MGIFEIQYSLHSDNHHIFIQRQMKHITAFLIWFTVIQQVFAGVMRSKISKRYRNEVPLMPTILHSEFAINSDLETKKILLVVDQLERSKLNSFVSSSTVELLTQRLAHLLPLSLLTQIPSFSDETRQIETLFGYVAQMYKNIDVGAIVSSLIHRGFISSEGNNMNRLKISIVLIALFKLKELSMNAQQTKRKNEHEVLDFGPDNIADWAS